MIVYRKGFALLFFVAWLGLLPGRALAAPAPVTLDPQNTIIISYVHNDNAAYAAGILQKWLRKVYRTESGFDVLSKWQVKEEMTRQKFSIALGPSPWGDYRPEDELGPYGFVIRRTDNVVSIVGTAPKPGTSPLQLNNLILGAAYFLDKYCGVRLYMPNDLFVGVPDKKSITLPARIDIVERPFTSSVSATGLINVNLEQLYEFQWGRFVGFARREWESHQHSMGNRFPPEKFAQKYPGIYPVFDGKRYIPQGAGDQQWQPDFAEPHLVDAAVESAIAYFKEKPHLNHISFSVQDSRRFSTEGKMGEALKNYAPEAQPGAYTDIYISFINKVAERLENELPRNGIQGRKTIVYLAYSNVSSVPKQKLHPNVMPVVVFRVAEIDMKGALYEANGVNPSSIADWLKVTKRIGIHDWAQGQGYFFPRLYSGQYAKLTRFIKEQGGILEFAHIECYPNWGLDGPKYYLMSKVLWNPDTDVDKELTRFCNDLFGRAAREMNSYFITLEQLTQSMNNNLNQYRKMFVFPQQLLLSEAEMALVQKARGHLNKAGKLARTSEAKQRIALFSKTFRLSEYLFEIANAKEIKREKLNEITRYVDEVIAPDPMTLYMARNPANLKGQVQEALNRSAAYKKIIE